MLRKFRMLVTGLGAAGALLLPVMAMAADEKPKLDTGDTAWMLMSTALVLLMSVPALALFYGGLVRQKNMLSVLIQVFVVFSLITVLWCVYGYSLAFTEGNSIIGGFDRLFLNGMFDPATGTFSMAATFSKNTPLYELVFAAFQATFAAITVCLVLGSIVERIKFSAVLIFAVIWFTISYLPIAHMVWFWAGPDAFTDPSVVAAQTAKGGLMWQWGALDFAGGTVVHINAGFAGVVGAAMLGKRIGFGREAMAPHSLTMTMIGASLLWFGWFGFNAGSALGANEVAVQAFVNTQLAAAAGLLGWVLFERVKERYPTTLGAASGAVAGMVAITPCAGYVSAMPALLIGAVAGVACSAMVRLKFRLGYDDSLDVLGVHGVGGVIGMVLLGLFATRSVNPAGADGLLNGGGLHFFGVELLAVVVSVVFCFGATWCIATVIDRTMGLRVTPEEADRGLDLVHHAETAYAVGGMGRSSL